MPKFEVFERARVGKDPLVTVQRKGNFTVSAAAWELMGRPEAARLMWSAEEGGIVGLQPCATDADHAYLLRAGNKNPNGPRDLAAGLFTQHYGIDTTDAKRYATYMEDGILCFKLSTGVVATRPARQAPAAKPRESEKPATPEAPSEAERAKNRQVREWAITNGFLARNTPGRTPQSVVEMYEKAHPPHRHAHLYGGLQAQEDVAGDTVDAQDVAQDDSGSDQVDHEDHGA